MILTEGPWYIDEIFMRFSNTSSVPGESINEWFSYRIITGKDNPITISPENPGIRNIDLPTGEAIVKFSIAGQPGATLSNPRLSGSSVLVDENNRVVSIINFGTWSPDIDVETANTRFIGMEGTYNVTATATVGGSGVTFGKLTINIVPGTSQVIDIGGPSLTVEFPEPGFITSNSNITVTGIVTDDVAVAWVTVNGVNAALVSTNNPSDTAEMSFSATINNLDRGPNEIITVATDTAGPPKTSSDTRTVFRDEGGGRQR